MLRHNCVTLLRFRTYREELEAQNISNRGEYFTLLAQTIELGSHGDARGRLGFAQELLSDARRQRFANVPLLQLYGTILQRIGTIESAYTAMRIAVGHQFAHTLEPSLMVALHCMVQPVASMLQTRFCAVAARAQSALRPTPPLTEPLHESIQHLRSQYLEAMAKQLDDVGLQAGAVAQQWDAVYIELLVMKEIEKKSISKNYQDITSFSLHYL